MRNLYKGVRILKSYVYVFENEIESIILLFFRKTSIVHMNVHMRYVDFTDGTLMIIQVFSVNNKQARKDITLQLNKKIQRNRFKCFKNQKLAIFLGLELKKECPKSLPRIHKTRRSYLKVLNSTIK